MLEEQPAEQKLALCLLASGLVSGGAALVCWLCGLDPLGGASLSVASLHAAAVGGAASAPLVGAKALLWSETARRELPFLEDIHRAQVGTWPRAAVGAARTFPACWSVARMKGMWSGAAVLVRCACWPQPGLTFSLRRRAPWQLHPLAACPCCRACTARRGSCPQHARGRCAPTSQFVTSP